MGQLGRTQKSQAVSEKKLKAYACELEQKLEARTRELADALEQQTATSEILGLIAASPTNIQPVLQAVAESACRICEAYDSVIRLCEGELLRYQEAKRYTPVILPKMREDLNRHSTPMARPETSQVPVRPFCT